MSLIWRSRRRRNNSRPVHGKRTQLGIERLEERQMLDAALPNAAQFVTALYYDVMHRSPSPTEVAAWAGFLNQGHSRDQVAASFVMSGEYRIDLIRQDYETLLGRDPEAGVTTTWLRSMSRGMGEQSLLLNIVSSAEYYQRNGGTNASWVTALYRDVLGRTPDAGPLRVWTRMLDNGVPRGSVAIEFVFSPEQDNRIIASEYETFLGRSPDPGSAIGWLAAFEHGTSAEQLLETLVSSTEYLGQQYGVNLALDVGSGGTSIPASGAAPLNVVLQIPDFTTNVYPMVTISVGNAGFTGRVRIDVDADHNGIFDDPTDMNETTALINPQKNSFVLNYLGRGTYLVRARVTDGFGRTYLSQTMSITVDPFAGVVGSQQLLNLHSDFMTTLHSVGDNGGDMPRGFFSSRSDTFTFDEEDRVKVNVRATLPGHLNDLANSLTQLGIDITSISTDQSIVTGFLPIAQITNLPSVAHFAAVTPSYAVIRRTGSAETQGDSVIMANTFRSDFNVTGQGVTVGVISDSVNQVGGGISQSQSTGDLPTQGVNVLEDGPSGSTDEGRAMLEIVHDVAPGASLAFHTGTQSPQDFANGIRQLASAGAKVIVDDIGWLDSPMFNDGIIAQAVDQVHSQGVFYASAAGNEGSQGFMFAWRSDSTTVGGTSGTFFDLGGGNPLQSFTLQSGQSFQLDFQWDNAFLEGGSSNPNYQVKTEVDVLITTSDGSRVLQQFSDNTLNTNEAVQIGTFTNDGSFGTNNFAMAFLVKQGPAPTMIRWVAFGTDPLAQGEGASTIFGQPAAAGAVAVGAVPWYDPQHAESFSSLGGAIPILFDANGNRLATPELRNKPDVAAPDGVDTSFFGSPAPSGDPDQHPRFFGTSAAAPHVAAAAALLMQQFPPATPDILAQHLMTTAVPVANSSASNDVSGAGLIQLVPLSAPPPPPPPPTPTPTGPITPHDDPFEFNDSSDRATPIGLMGTGTLVGTGLTIFDHSNGLADTDWYSLFAAVSGRLTIAITYTISSGTDLHLRAFTLDANGMLVQLGASMVANTNNQIVAFNVTAGMPIYIWVYGFNHSQGTYNLALNLA